MPGATVVLLTGLLLFLPLGQAAPPPAADAQIRVSGADANNTIATDTSASSMHRVLLLDEVRGTPVDVQVSVWPILSPGATVVDLKGTICDTNASPPDPLTFSARSIVRLCIDSKLPSVGSYKAALSLLYKDGDKDRRDTYILAIERHAPAAVVSLTGLPVGPADTGLLPLNWPPQFAPDLQLRVTLAETAGLGAILSPPDLLELSQFGPNDTAVQVPLGIVKVLDEHDLVVSDSINLGPYETKIFKLKLTDQDHLGPGQYRARVQVRTSDAGIAQTALDVRLRHHWIWALLVVVLGALGSLFLRTWIDSGRARAIQDQRLQEQLRQIPMGSWPGNRLNQSLVARLESASTAVDLGQSLDVDKFCQQVQKLLPLINEINVRLDQSGLSDPMKDALDASVTAARDAINALLDDPNADPKAANEKLREVIDAITRAKQAAALQTEVDSVEALADHPLVKTSKTSMATHIQAARQAIATIDVSTARAELTQALAPNGLQTDLATSLKRELDAWGPVLQLPQPPAGIDLDPEFDQARAAFATATSAVRDLEQASATDVRAVLKLYNTVVGDMKVVTNALPKQTRDQLLKDRKRTIPTEWTESAPKSEPNIVQRLLANKASPVTERTRAFGNWHIKSKDYAISGIAIVVSALVGLQLLWVANATFGALTDYITALVWGFGLHQLNETARQAGPAAIGAVLRTGGK
jgi:hypothetical protein